MKFIELKKQLQNSLKPIYLIEGDDRFVVKNALNLIEKSVGLAMPELNKLVIEGGKSNSAELVLDQVSSYPMMDSKKLIILKEFNTGGDFKKLEQYFKNPNDFTIVVVLSYAPCEFTKKLAPLVEVVDANKLDDVSIKNWICANLRKEGKSIEEKALNNLILYSSHSLTKIETELNKLVSVPGEVITDSIVDAYVTKDRDYQIFELTEYLAQGNALKVFDLVDFMLSEDKNNVGLIQFLYGAFRRLLIISLSSSSDDELGKELNIKPYAVKKSRGLASKFTPKKLKSIVNELSNLEYGIKAGKVNLDASLTVAICKILQK